MGKKTIPSKLKAWLARENLTHEQAARRLRVPISTLTRWLYGVSEPSAASRALINILVGE